MNVTNALLHYIIIKFIIETGYAPDVNKLAELLNITETKIETGLLQLQDYHGVVLHPNSSKIWVIHPFSSAPTNFIVKTVDKMWWGNCAWCSLGIAALVKQDITIHTRSGADGDIMTIEIKAGKLLSTDAYVHFPVQMKHAWDNVIYTCSVMLAFTSKMEIETWCTQHNIQKGDIQPITKVWEFAKVWYGNHLNSDWKKWTNEEAGAIFERFDLGGNIWNIPQSDERF